MDEETEPVPLSDIESLSESGLEDIVPHHQLTINNTKAILAAYKSIALDPSLPFSEHQSLSSAAQVEIHDVNDDLGRELAFYKQSLQCAVEARAFLKQEGIPFSRPNDYFAEMVKNDEHMGRVKDKLVEQAAHKKAAAEAKKQRQLKKFGKQVQIAKLQERSKAKRDALAKIDSLKRSKHAAQFPLSTTMLFVSDHCTERNVGDIVERDGEDAFDIALDRSNDMERADRPTRDRSAMSSRTKRQRKDAKFGFGGRKRHAKSGDAISSGDLRDFSARRMKGQKKARLGKSRRAKSSR